MVLAGIKEWHRRGLNSFRTQGFSVGRVFKLRLTVSRGVKQSAYAFEQIVRHITGGGHALVRIVRAHRQYPCRLRFRGIPNHVPSKGGLEVFCVQSMLATIRYPIYANLVRLVKLFPSYSTFPHVGQDSHTHIPPFASLCKDHRTIVRIILDRPYSCGSVHTRLITVRVIHRCEGCS